jgi:polyisoprenoid-binding protein YceI
MSNVTAPAIAAGTWNVDPAHTRVGFVARHLMVTKVRGEFKGYTADVQVAENLTDSTVKVVVQMDSIDTGAPDRDNHLRSNDFFDIATHPTMTLDSTRIERDGSQFVLFADLTIKGVSRQVEFALEFDGTGQDPWGGQRAGFTATATIDRNDFGVSFNAPLETGGVLVSDKVAIELEVQLIQAS